MKSSPRPADGFERDWRRRFERFAAMREDDAGIAGWSPGGLEARYRHFVRAWHSAGVVPAGHWLDAGCGAGTYTRLLVASGLRVTAVDYSLPTIRKARNRVTADVRWTAADVTQLPFADGVFDGALCFGVMQALSACVPALRELRRVLRVGGELWVDALNARCLAAQFGELRRRLRGAPQHLRYDLPTAFCDDLQALGFAVVATHWVPVLPSSLLALQPLLESQVVRWLLARSGLLGASVSHSLLVYARAVPLPSVV